VVCWLYAGFIGLLFSGDNKMNYTVCVVEDAKVSRKMTIELLSKMEIAKIVASTNEEIALQKLKMQKQILLFPIGIYRLWMGWNFISWLKRRRSAKHSLSDGDCGRLKIKSARSIKVENP
jgi:hypothetical protein